MPLTIPEQTHTTYMECVCSIYQIVSVCVCVRSAHMARHFKMIHLISHCALAATHPLIRIYRRSESKQIIFEDDYELMYAIFNDCQPNS